MGSELLNGKIVACVTTDGSVCFVGEAVGYYSMPTYCVGEYGKAWAAHLTRLATPEEIAAHHARALEQPKPAEAKAEGAVAWGHDPIGTALAAAYIAGMQGKTFDVDAARAAIAEPPRAVGDGFVVVPREPTEDMLAAFRSRYDGPGDDMQDFEQFITAAIAAAPKAGEA